MLKVLFVLVTLFACTLQLSNLDNVLYGIAPLDQYPDVSWLYCTPEKDFFFSGGHGTAFTFLFMQEKDGDEYYLYGTGCNGFMMPDLNSGEMKIADTFQPQNVLWYVTKSRHYEGYKLRHIHGKCLDLAADDNSQILKLRLETCADMLRTQSFKIFNDKEI